MITVEQAKSYLVQGGVTTIPDVLIEAMVMQLNSVNECLEENYPPYTIILIQYALLAIFASFETNQQLANQYADGAGRGFRYKDHASYLNGLYARLLSLDTFGCTASITPINPEKNKAFGGMFVVTGGCYE